jgi:lactoylglutathione lyase
MPRISHIAIKVMDLEEATKFYTEVYGFKHVHTGRNAHAPDHISRHLTDGHIDLALMQYDSEDAAEAQLAGAGPCIHHIGIDVEDRAAFADKIEAAGGEILSERDVKGALKYRSPDGTVAEIVQAGDFDGMRKRAEKEHA